MSNGPLSDSSSSPARLAASRRTRYLAAGAGLLVVAVALSVGGGHTGLSAPKAIILGAVEGITEYLPVSSTGHLLVAERILDLGSGSGKTAADTFAVAIQIGAIFAVIALYWKRIEQMLAGLVGRDSDGRQLLVRLVVAFIPAAVIGLALDDTIKKHLFGTPPVIGAWVVGGIFLLVWRPRHGHMAITELSMGSALVIGFAQVLALWPGTSRSLVTIVAALAVGLTMEAAVEFSFLLGLATLTAATLHDLSKHGHELVHDYGVRTPALGTLVAFVTAVVAVRWLVGYLRTKPLSNFGWYRLGVAAITLGLLAANVI
jgi:undecaprenyl-diphosphatase